MMKTTAQGRVVLFTPFRNFNFERTFQAIAGGYFSPVSQGFILRSIMIPKQ